jgi:hypothetical protein
MGKENPSALRLDGLPSLYYTSCMSRFRLAIARVALFATLLGALAPAFTQVLGFYRGDLVALSEICKAGGRTHQPGEHQTPADTHGDSCPFCFNSAVTHAPPPALVHFDFVAASPFATPAFTLVFSDLPDPWNSSRPRGPPVPV